MGPAHLPVAGADTPPQGHHWVGWLKWEKNGTIFRHLSQKLKIRQSVGTIYFHTVAGTPPQKNTGMVLGSSNFTLLVASVGGGNGSGSAPQAGGWALGGGCPATGSCVRTDGYRTGCTCATSSN